MSMPPLDPEARLLLATTHPLGLQPSTAADALAQGVHWPRLHALALRHAATPLMHRALSQADAAAAPFDVPEGFRLDLRRQAQVNRLRNALLVDELARLCAHLEAAGVQAVSYKGPVLSQQVWGDIGLRVCTDLDVMIRAEHMDRAMPLMAALGYRFVPLRGQHASQDARHNLKRWHSCNFVRGGTAAGVAPVAVDLHVRFAPAFFPVPAQLDTFAHRLQACTVGTHTLTTFAREDALVLAALHAGKDLMWKRLTWFSEMAALVVASEPLQWQTVLATAQRLGALRVLHVSLELVSMLYGIEAPPLGDIAAAERTRARRHAADVMQRLFAESPPPDAPLRTHFVVHPALRERWRERWPCYIGGFHALAKYLQPPPDPSAAVASWADHALVRYPLYWLKAGARRAQRAAVASRSTRR